MAEKKIRETILKGNTGEYSHVLIVCNLFDYKIYPVYVKCSENIQIVIAHYNDWNNMSRVIEIYSYNSDLERQLNETNAYHTYSIVKTRKPLKMAAKQRCQLNYF